MENCSEFNTRKRAGYLEGGASIVVNTILFAVKLHVGLISNSIAIIGDAFHTFSDTLTSIALLVGYKVSSKPPDAEHPFGHGRFELITNLIIGVLLAVIGYEIAKTSLDKLIYIEPFNLNNLALLVLALSALVKLALAIWAHRLGTRVCSEPVKTDALHHVADAVVTSIVIIGLYSGRGYWQVDAVLGFFISFVIIYVAYRIVRDTSSELLGRSPTEKEINAIKEIIKNVHNSYLDVHHIHIHRYGDHVEVTLHVKLPGDMSLREAHEIATRLENMIRQKMGYEATVHVEPVEETRDHRD